MTETMRQIGRLAGAAALALACAGPAAAVDLAAVLGSAAYDTLRDVRDGRAPLDAVTRLEDAGIDVLQRRDAAAEDIDTLVAELEQMAPSADRLLVVLSGRFLHSASESYFLPTDLEDARLARVAEDGLALSTVTAFLARLPRDAVLVLAEDSRAEGGGGYLEPGLGEVAAPEGVSVVRTTPGRAAALMRETLAVPGARLAEGASGDVELSGYAPSDYAFLPAGRGDGSRDEAYWDVATDLDTRDSYRSYLDRYPDGRHAGEARARIEELSPAAQAERQEAALNLGRAERQQIQKDLTILGFDTRGTEGIFGQGTRGAVANWQERNGYDATSYLTRPQITALAEDASAARQKQAEERRAADERFWRERGSEGTADALREYLDRFPEGAHADLARDELDSIEKNKAAQRAEADDRAWRRAQQADTEAAYREYLDSFPEGRHAEDAEAIVAQRSGPAQGEQEEQALNLSAVARRLLEQRLDGLGYRPGPVDGSFDGRTRNAIAAYQADAGMQQTGYVSQPMVVRLLADSLKNVLQ